MQSKNYKNWIAILDLKTCKPCRRTHGQIYEIDELSLFNLLFIGTADVKLNQWKQRWRVLAQRWVWRGRTGH